jgi:hypothetical protein
MRGSSAGGVARRRRVALNSETNMAIEWTTVIEGGIPILGGLYATALGYGFAHTSRAMPNPQTQKTVRLFRWLGPLVVLFGIFTAWPTHAHVNHPPAEQLAKEIRRRMTFPVKVDAITEATGVEGRGDTLIYEYSIAASLQQLGGRERVQQELEEQGRKAICTAPDSLKLLRNGYTLARHYTFHTSADDLLVSISTKSCG